MTETSFKMDSALRRQIKDEFPGALIPDMKKDDEAYMAWWRKMVMWAYKFGPILLEVVDEKASSNRHGDRRIGPEQQQHPDSGGGLPCE